jgi:hypothetical protein
MAAIPVTITGTMTYTGLEVGGGPLPGGAPPALWPPAGVVTPPIYYPPEIWPTPPAKPPLGIWGGGNVPYPTPPIYYPAPPLGIWGGGNVPYPQPPIYFPPPEAPTAPPSGSDGKWGYVPGLGWVWVPAGSGDKPHPPQVP